MSNRIVHRPEPSHECTPGWREASSKHVCAPDWCGESCPLEGTETTRKIRPDSISHPPGTVVECECGRTFVSYEPPMPTRGMVMVHRIEFRRERWWERRRRRRGQRPVAGHTSGPAYRELPQVSNRPAAGAHVSASDPTSIERFPTVPAGPAQGAVDETGDR